MTTALYVRETLELPDEAAQKPLGDARRRGLATGDPTTPTGVLRTKDKMQPGALSAPPGGGVVAGDHDRGEAGIKTRRERSEA